MAEWLMAMHGQGQVRTTSLQRKRLWGQMVDYGRLGQQLSQTPARTLMGLAPCHMADYGLTWTRPEQWPNMAINQMTMVSYGRILDANELLKDLAEGVADGVSV